jgi:hypothetical protein
METKCVYLQQRNELFFTLTLFSKTLCFGGLKEFGFPLVSVQIKHHLRFDNNKILLQIRQRQSSGWKAFIVSEVADCHTDHHEHPSSAHCQCDQPH